MQKHKWYNEIVAWASGAEIEGRVVNNKAGLCTEWAKCFTPNWNDDDCEFRIKPQPKEPQYLYVYQMGGKMELAPIKRDTLNFVCGDREIPFNYAGKIKLENEDES